MSVSDIIQKKDFIKQNKVEVAELSEKRSLDDASTTGSDTKSWNGNIAATARRPSSSHSLSSGVSTAVVTKRQMAAEHLVAQRLQLQKLQKKMMKVRRVAPCRWLND